MNVFLPRLFVLHEPLRSCDTSCRKQRSMFTMSKAGFLISAQCSVFISSRPALARQWHYLSRRVVLTFIQKFQDMKFCVRFNWSIFQGSWNVFHFLCETYTNNVCRALASRFRSLQFKHLRLHIWTEEMQITGSCAYTFLSFNTACAH